MDIEQLSKKNGYEAGKILKIAQSVNLNISNDGNTWTLDESPETIKVFKRYLKTHKRLQEQ